MPQAGNHRKRLKEAVAARGRFRVACAGAAAAMIAAALLPQTPALGAQQRAAQQGTPHAMSGFAAGRIEKEMAAEENLRAAISTDQIQKYHRYFTAEPYPAGSPRNNELAQYVAEEWRRQGLEDVLVHEYNVLHSSPREVSLEMVSPVYYRAGLREEAYEVDPDTKIPGQASFRSG